MRELARRLGALSGWRRLAAAAGFGAISVLALPPIYAVPVLFVSFTGLVWLIDGIDGGPRTGLKALALGWWFGFAHFIGGLYWITNALFVDAATHGWLAPFAVSGLALYFAAYPALACWAASRAPLGVPRVLVLAAAWAATEWLRGLLLTGFPWNLISTSLAFDAAAIQGAALFGAYGLSLVVVVVAAAPATLGVPAPGPARALPFGVAMMLAVAIGGAGFARVASVPVAGAAVTDVTLRIVQGNIDQRLKWRGDLARSHFQTYLGLSRAGGRAAAPDAVIWPETAVPFSLSGNPALVRALKRAVPADGVLITGAVRTNPPGKRPRRLWNAVLAVTRQGIVATYDKHHLVPFGEYVPARKFLPITKITAGRIDFTPGPGARSLDIPGLPRVSPLVCYEVIFPGAVVAPGPRPRWLLNLTNDAWFGQSTGPYQHLAAARLRAVEEGLPLVRAANTGISAVIDPWGRVLEALPLGRRGVIQRRLPAALDQPPPFARFGNWGFAFAVFLVFLFALWIGRRRTGPDHK
jgi:apolipoprotein N-acyltransferase